jgi:hypothetical protein
MYRVYKAVTLFRKESVFRFLFVIFKFTPVDTTNVERQLNDSLFPARLDSFFIEDDDILGCDAV